MKITPTLAISSFVSLASTQVNAFTSISNTNNLSTQSRSGQTINAGGRRQASVIRVATSLEDQAISTSTELEVPLNYETINNLKFRELQAACKKHSIPAVGSTAVLRNRLLESCGLLRIDQMEESEEECSPDDITFCDESDATAEFNSLLAEVNEKASLGHWKAATRKLKKLNKKFATSEMPVPSETYISVLEACLDNRLHGARASEPARKILEQMAELNYAIPPDYGNSCIMNALGDGPGATHDGCGGIDTALAMLAALETQGSFAMISDETYSSIIAALSKDTAVDEAMLLLRAMVVEHSFTPALSTFSDVAHAATKVPGKEESVLQVLTLAKAAGYVLDNVASAESGRFLLASGVIAAERIDNLGLGLRLLTAARKAEGCEPETGDSLVASSSSGSQRACTLIHRRAIDEAIQKDNWKLAVKLLELMKERSLTPSASVWRKVVSVCAKCEKSRKATSLLFEWINASEEGKIEKPPLKAFNTVMNTCEICGEEELTLMVLETMKKLHDTDGNIITFNIALKRLAKQGQARACEGIIIGMLQAGVEPTVVSYTTAIGACVKANDSLYAYEWLKRMRSRNVKPNFHTYNTALAACLDGKLESSIRGSTIAKEMLDDVEIEITEGLKGPADYSSVIPDKYSKVLSRSLMKQLRDNWRAGDINMAVAKATIREPLLRLVDFERSEAAEMIKKKREEEAAAKKKRDLECLEDAELCEADVDFSAVNALHKEGSRRMEV